MDTARLLETAILSVEFADQEVDLELPVHLPGGQLAAAIASRLGQTPAAALTLQVFICGESQGQALDADQTLAKIGAWTGSRLVLRQALSP